MVSICRETPLQDDVSTMVTELNACLRPLSPAEFRFQMTAEQMSGDDTPVFVACDGDGDGNAVCMGALKVHDGELGEVKRMFTNNNIRGTGMGRLILDTIEDVAREKCLNRLVLETGYSRFYDKTLN